MFTRQETCAICKTVIPCEKALGYAEHPQKTIGIVPGEDAEVGVYTLSKRFGYCAEFFACKECARREGKKKIGLAVFWGVTMTALLLVLVLGLVTSVFENKDVVLALSILIGSVSIILGVIISAKAYRFSATGLWTVLAAFTPLSLVTVPRAAVKLCWNNRIRTALPPYVRAAFAEMLKERLETDEKNVCEREGHLWEEEEVLEGANEEMHVSWRDTWYRCSRCGRYKLASVTTRDGKITAKTSYHSNSFGPGPKSDFCKRLTGHEMIVAGFDDYHNEEADIRSRRVCYRCVYCGKVDRKTLYYY
jgi:hypothetical protein